MQTMSVLVPMASEPVTIPMAKWLAVPLPFAQQNPLDDVTKAVGDALEQPIDFPAFRKALTPDDLIVIVVPPRLNQLWSVLQPLIEHIQSAQIGLDQIILLQPPLYEAAQRLWEEKVPSSLQGIQISTHNPKERAELAFLTSTTAGKGIYLNRLLLDAGQVFVIGQMGFDPVFGFQGGLDQLYPLFSHEQAWQDHQKKLSPTQIGSEHSQAAQEANEVGRLLGFPLFVQVFEGIGDQVWAIRAGLGDNIHEESCRQWQRAATVPIHRQADLVIAAIGKPAKQQSFHDISAALANASRAVKHQGKMVVVSQAGGTISPGFNCLSKGESTVQALAQARQQHANDIIPLWQLVTAAEQGHLFFWTNYPTAMIEEMGLTPMQDKEELQRLIDQAESVMYLAEAERSLVELKSL